MTNTTFLGLPCTRLANTAVSLLITHTVGPRILALHLGNGPNLFAELPHFTIPCPGANPLHLWGGHRLWHAPEVAARTYLPDDRPVSLEVLADGLRATPPVEERTGLQKSLTIRLPGEQATVIIDHTLTNWGMWPVTCAPWAITQLKPGGVAILPQTAVPLDADGLLPNRTLALWPYTDMHSQHITWGNRYVLVTAQLSHGALKLGWPNRAGWLAYLWQGMLFVKQARFNPQATYYDFDSSSECYAHREFLELETLGPVTTIAPGESVTHQEVWQVFGGVHLAAMTETAVADLLATLHLA